MLVKCPKCGFDQPDDNYCAKCGIEMASYKPAKIPIWKQIVKSPMFSLVIFLGLAYVTFLSVKNPRMWSSLTKTLLSSSHNSSPTERPLLPPNPGGSLPVSTAQPSPVALATSLPHDDLGVEPNHPQDSKSQLTQQENNPPGANAPSASPPSDPTVAHFETKTTELESSPTMESNQEATERVQNLESIKGPLSIDVRFIEAPLSAIQQFLAEASENSSGDTGEMSFAIVKNSSRWLRQKALTELDHFTKKVPGVKKKLQWFKGGEHPETHEPLGLNFQISIVERNGGHLVGDLVISRSFVENKGGNFTKTRKDFSTRFETDVGSLIGLIGVMPHTPIASKEKDWLQDSLLKLYLSPQFLENESELLILLQFKADSK